MDIGMIFDWDGVIIDSSSAHEASWERLATQKNLPLPEGHFKRGFGRKNTYIIPEILGWAHDATQIAVLGAEKERLYRAILKEKPPQLLPGVRALLAALKAEDIPCVVGSSTDRANITLCMELCDLGSFFTEIVSAEDVTKGKPDPAVFLKAAEKIARQPECCIVFEDAFAGLEAAKNGGMKAVAVATTHPLESLRDKADIAVQSLSEINVAILKGMFQA